MSKPFVVGITGGIGSGKTTVCKILETFRKKVYYADDRGRWLSNFDPEVVASIQSLLGKEAYLDRVLNRSWVGKKAFGNKALLSHLNQIIHPAVSKDFANWKKRNQSEHILFYEAALLFENNTYPSFSTTILVSAKEALRIERVLHRDPHRSLEDVKTIISRQLPENEKLRLANYIIKNDGVSLVQQVEKFLKKWEKVR